MGDSQKLTNIMAWNEGFVITAQNNKDLYICFSNKAIYKL